MRNNGWQQTTLGAIARQDGYGLVDGPFGSNLPASEYVASGIPVLRGSNLSLGVNRFVDDEFVFVSEGTAQRLRRSLCGPDDIIFTKKGTLAQTAIIPRQHRFQKFLLSSNQMKLSVDPGVADPLFVYYYVSSPTSKEKIIRDAEATGVPKTNLAYIKTFPITLPLVPEQRAISHVLGALDDKIELNRRMNETLEATAQALFKSWFVSFDPVRAKASGQTPAGLDPKIAALFPDRFEQSDLGEMPVGWNRMPIFELAEINAWTLGKNDELDRMEYIEISEVSRGNIGNIQVFERGEEPSRARRRLRHGDTVMSTVRPDRGSYFLCLHPSPYSIASTGFAVITPTRAPWSFIHTAITRSDVFEHLGQQADGGAYPAISPEIIGKWQVTWPDQSAIVVAFHNMCGALYELAEANRRQSRSLAAFREALLPKLLSGDIRIDGIGAG